MEGRLSPRGFHQNDRIYQQDVFLYFIQGRLKFLDVIVLKSHNRCTNQLASSIVFGCLSLSSPTGSSQKNIKKKSYNLRSLALCSVFYAVIIRNSLTNSNLLQHSFILIFLCLGKKEKKSLIIIKSKGEVWVMNSPCCPVYCFFLLHFLVR